MGFFIPGSIAGLSTHLVIAALALVHLLIDFAKVQLAAKRVIRGGAGSFVVDQFVYLLTVVLNAWLLSPGMSSRRSPPRCKLPGAWGINFSPCP